jgi:hypothetical protein
MPERWLSVCGRPPIIDYMNFMEATEVWLKTTPMSKWPDGLMKMLMEVAEGRLISPSDFSSGEVSPF